MSFDGVVINSLAGELDNILAGSKIDKVYQPEKDEICLKIRGKNDNYKLILSASASYPRVYLANQYEKQNPKKAPVFCMTLRKYIQNGIIVGIEQVGFERIVKISVDSYDELREKTTKELYIEIMGKHSNIILVSKNENRIIDSIKRVPFSISRLRQILPGIEYELPPSQDKLNPMKKIEIEDLKDRFEKFDGSLYKAIYSNIQGFSPLIAKEICHRIGLNPELPANKSFLYDYKRICDQVNSMSEMLIKKEYYPNIIIDDNSDKIIEFSSIKLSVYENFKEIKYDSMSTAVEEYYQMKDIKDRIKQKSSVMKKNISLRLDRVNNKIKKQEKELKEAEKAEEYKIKGELITSYIYLIKQGMKSIRLANFYDENKEIEISLKENLSPSENAQKYFKKYNKLKTASEELSRLIIENKEEAEYLENTILSIDNCESNVELKEIREELIREGYIKSYKIPKKNNKPNTELLKYISSAGNIIIVGKNNKQNDYLTLRLADNEDMWFHTKNIPGSHVLLKCAGKKVDENEIREAALLAAYYSKAKMSSNVPVDYTIRKNVKKPSGAKPGLVIYEKNKTIYITPSEEEKSKIVKY